MTPGTSADAPRISVIIPALNEEATIVAAIRSAHGNAIEVIVVDGGSTDRTVRFALDAGAKVMRAQRGRAQQMNAGAAIARGEVLLFLHADTTLPQDFDEAVLRDIKQPNVVACAFRLSIEAEGRSFRLIERAANIRSRIFQLPYGDQALFIRAEVFEKIGGFPNLPIMEDYALIRYLRRAGRIAVSPLAVVTSPRRWIVRGIWQTTVVNQVCIVAYWLGISLARIAQWRVGRGPAMVRTQRTGLNLHRMVIKEQVL